MPPKSPAAKTAVDLALFFLFSVAVILLFIYFLVLGARKAKADIRAADADERIATALENMESRGQLPRPSLLHPADLKPIPPPDPEPCANDDDSMVWLNANGRDVRVCGDGSMHPL